MDNGKTKGINTAGIKQLGLDMIEYAQEFKKIKNSIQTIANRLRKSMAGEVANEYINSLNEFCENFDYICDNIKNYSDACYQIIHLYEEYDENEKIV